MNIYVTKNLKKSTVTTPEEIKPEILVDTNTCGCCGAKEFTVLTSLYQKPDINYIRCNRCGAVTYDRIYSQKGIDQLYHNQEYYSSYEECGTSEITFFGAERFAEHVSTLIKKHSHSFSKKDISILDFGGGSGELAYALAKILNSDNEYEKITIVVVDYDNSKLYCENDSIIKMNRTFPVSDINNTEFDIVLASAVIEHLPNPGEIIRKLFDLTGKNGFLYFRTPYIFPLFKTLKKFGINIYTGFPDHIWDLGKQWWDNVSDHVSYDKTSIKILSSKPSIVEKSFKADFIRALISHVMKSFWYINHKWPYVGGWELFCQKIK